ncbi:MAG: putative sulfate/molybdate transporter [Geminicoccaceae bacterium]
MIATIRTWSRRTGWVGDLSGAFADLGIFLPLVVGVLIVGDLDPSGLLLGFGIFAVATGLIYRLPIPVQPMKIVAALAIAGGMGTAAVAASGVLLGVALLVLGVSGLINRVDRLVPRTVLLGIQLGLGLQLVQASIGFAGPHLAFGALVLALLIGLQMTPIRSSSCFLLLAGAIIWSLATGASEMPSIAPSWHMPSLVIFDLGAFREAFETGFLPQLALTLTNAVLLTAVMAADYFPKARERATTQRLALSSGALNLLLAPFGALPMCHGAGGLAAQYHQGARSGLAPVIFGMACLLLGILAASQALEWLLLVPIPVVAALLAYAGVQLAHSKRLANVGRFCLAIIVLTALSALLINPAFGLIVGLAAEFLRSRINRHRQAAQ